MDLKLMFLDCFDSEFKDKNYKIFRFVDLQSLSIISGTDLEGEFEPYKVYNCHVEWKHNKFKVVAAH